jgi:CubicO group peptidase (beta-lactamase class C family)
MSLNKLDKFLYGCTLKGRIPGCVCWIGNTKKTIFFRAYGYAQIVPKKIEINKNTIFDCASITKPIATALSVMLLYEKKMLKLDDKIMKFLPSFKNHTNGNKTIKQLLTHTSGIPAWFPLYVLPEERRMMYLADANMGKKTVIYSCLGYIILGKIVEKISSERLDHFVYKNIFKKAGIKNTGFGPVKKKNLAATEYGNYYEKMMASKHGNTSKIKWRNSVIKGEVHDGNSFYCFNGVSGNAGLFSNANDLSKLTRHYCTGQIVHIKTLKLMIKNYTKGAEKRGLGWVINPYPEVLSASTFSHTGFTGTMLCIDPEKDLIIILLANAVHPNVKINIMDPIRNKVVCFAVSG